MRPVGFALSRLAWLTCAAAGGAVVAFISYHLWSLKTPLLVVIVAAVALVAFSTLFLRRFTDFLLVGLLASIPFASFTKSLFFTSWDVESRIKAVMRFSGIVSVSAPDILLFGLYFMWALKVIVLRTAPWPSLCKQDIFPLMMAAAYLFSLPGSPEPKAALFGLVFLTRHILIYFFLSRHLERRHFPWIILAFCFAILLETTLGGFQYATGKWLSLAWSRGVGEGLDAQYIVPGIEHIKRATGTTFDSHSYGIYMAMLAPFPFAAMFARFASGGYRILWAGLFLLAMIGIVLSFSRSAWLSALIALGTMWIVHLLWGERRILLPTFLFALLMLILAPWYGPLVYERISSAESELLTSRFEQFPVAWAVWKDHFLFGYGVGNYMHALKTYNEPGVIELPVHNVFLWVAAEAGLFGVIAFFGVALTALGRTWRVIRNHREPTCTFALAVFGALSAYMLDGLTDPLYREPVVYLMFWICVAMSVALARVESEARHVAHTNRTRPGLQRETRPPSAATEGA